MKIIHCIKDCSWFLLFKLPFTFKIFFVRCCKATTLLANQLSSHFSVLSRLSIEIREGIQWEGCFPCLSPGRIEIIGMWAHVLCAAVGSTRANCQSCKGFLGSRLGSYPDPRTEVLVLLGQESELRPPHGHRWLYGKGIEIGCSSDPGNSIYFMGSSVVASF